VKQITIEGFNYWERIAEVAIIETIDAAGNALLVLAQAVDVLANQIRAAAPNLEHDENLVRPESVTLNEVADDSRVGRSAIDQNLRNAKKEKNKPKENAPADVSANMFAFLIDRVDRSAFDLISARALRRFECNASSNVSIES
jgi:hypothetical protein